MNSLLAAFLDTEFHSTPRGVTLLSVALILGNHEFYFEMDPISIEKSMNGRPPEFLRQEVLSQFGLLPGAAGTPAWIANRTVECLNTWPDETPVCYDYSTDFDLLERLIALASLPLTIRLVPTKVSYLLEDPDGIAAAEECWADLANTRGLRRHHALADAYALRARFDAVHGL